MAENRRVKCFVRVRPILASDHCGPDTVPSLYRGHDGRSLCVAGGEPMTFDEVFAPDAPPSSLIAAIVVPGVADVLAGKYCAVAAFGMTGSGKTTTTAQLLPAFVESLIQVASDEGSEIETKLFVECVQIYLESVHDLLDPSKKNLQLRESEDEGVFVKDATQIAIHSEADFAACWEAVNRNRAVAATQLNAASSRSHCIVTLRTTRRKRVAQPLHGAAASCLSTANTSLNTTTLSALLDVSGGAHPQQNQSQHQQHETSYSKTAIGSPRARSAFSSLCILRGRMQFADLAGSERLKKSGSEGMRQVEAQHINQSLSTLGKVIHALADRNATHVPYRDSKLTRLLQDALGCGGTSCIIVTVSPAPAHMHETRQSLAFGMRAMQIVQSVTTWEAIDPQSRLIATQEWLEERVAKLERECMLLETDRDAARAEVVFLKDALAQSQNLLRELQRHKKEQQQQQQQTSHQIEQQRLKDADAEAAAANALKNEVAHLQKKLVVQAQQHKQQQSSSEQRHSDELQAALTAQRDELDSQHAEEIAQLRRMLSREQSKISELRISLEQQHDESNNNNKTNVCDASQQCELFSALLPAAGARASEFHYGQEHHQHQSQQRVPRDDDELTEVSVGSHDGDNDDENEDEDDDDAFSFKQHRNLNNSTTTTTRRRVTLKNRRDLKLEWSQMRRAVYSLQTQVSFQHAALLLTRDEAERRHSLVLEQMQQRNILCATLSRAVGVAGVHSEAGARAARCQLETLHEMRAAAQQSRKMMDVAAQTTRTIANNYNDNTRDTGVDPILFRRPLVSAAVVDCATQSSSDVVVKQRVRMREAETATVPVRYFDSAVQATAAVDDIIAVASVGARKKDELLDVPVCLHRSVACATTDFADQEAAAIASSPPPPPRSYNHATQCNLRLAVCDAAVEVATIPANVAEQQQQTQLQRVSSSATSSMMTQTLPPPRSVNSWTMTATPPQEERKPQPVKNHLVDVAVETEARQQHQPRTQQQQNPPTITLGTQVPAEWQMLELEERLSSIHESVAESLLLSLRRRRGSNSNSSSSASRRRQQQRQPQPQQSQEDDDESRNNTPQHHVRDAFTEPDMQVAYGHSIDYCKAEMDASQRVMRMSCARAARVAALTQFKAELLLQSFPATAAALHRATAHVPVAFNTTTASSNSFNHSNYDDDEGLLDIEEAAILALTPIRQRDQDEQQQPHRVNFVNAAPATAAAPTTPHRKSISSTSIGVQFSPSSVSEGVQCQEEQQQPRQRQPPQLVSFSLQTDATPMRASPSQTDAVATRAAATNTEQEGYQQQQSSPQSHLPLLLRQREETPRIHVVGDDVLLPSSAFASPAAVGTAAASSAVATSLSSTGVTKAATLPTIARQLQDDDGDDDRTNTKSSRKPLAQQNEIAAAVATTHSVNASRSSTMSSAALESTARVLDLDAPLSRAPTPVNRSANNNSNNNSGSNEAKPPTAAMTAAATSAVVTTAVTFHERRRNCSPSRSIVSPPATTTEVEQKNSNNSSSGDNSLARVPATDMDAQLAEQHQQHIAAAVSPPPPCFSSSVSTTPQPSQSARRSDKLRSQRHQQQEQQEQQQAQQEHSLLNTTNSSSNGSHLVQERFEELMETRAKLSQLVVASSRAPRRPAVLPPPPPGARDDVEAGERAFVQETTQRSQQEQQQFQRPRRRAATPTPRLSRTSTASSSTFVGAERADSSLDFAAAAPTTDVSSASLLADERDMLLRSSSRFASHRLRRRQQRAATPPATARHRTQLAVGRQQQHQQQKQDVHLLSGTCQFCDVRSNNNGQEEDNTTPSRLERRCQRALQRFSAWKTQYTERHELQRLADEERLLRMRQRKMMMNQQPQFEQEEHEMQEEQQEQPLDLDAYPPHFFSPPSLMRSSSSPVAAASSRSRHHQQQQSQSPRHGWQDAPRLERLMR